jgi:hypothetical protein
MKFSIEEYFKKIASFADSEYGKMIRNNFADIKGSAELAMLAAPTTDELQQLQKALAIMTVSEKENAEVLTDEQIRKIADDAQIEPAMFAIFINGYALHCKKIKA